MEKNQDDSNCVPISSATNSRGNRGNRGNRENKI